MEKNKTVSVVELSPKQSRESSQYPVSPQVENIKEEKERVSNWITKEWMDGEVAHLFHSAVPAGKEKRVVITELVVTMNG